MNYIKATIITIILAAAASVAAQSNPVWPPPPDRARLEYVGEIDCRELRPSSGFFGKIGRALTGRSDDELLALPFDIVVDQDKLYMVCQNVSDLIEIDRAKGSFTLRRDEKNPPIYPIAVCRGGQGVIFMTDSEGGAIYKLEDEKLKLFISSDLTRPTGIAALVDQKRLYVVDTGEHALKIFDYDGRLLSVIKEFGDGEKFHFPTFVKAFEDKYILVNDALNYKIRLFDSDGNYISGFGAEGDSPGTFSRPKGMAVDSDSHIYLIDNLFDNLQIFNTDGQVLLVAGNRGQLPGQFWSPAGIDISNDTLFIADTFNHRIQILHYLGDSQ